METKSSFAMDGAVCRKAADGTVTIKRQSARNWLLLVVFGIFELLLLLVLVSSVLGGKGRIGDLLVIGGGALLLGAVMWILFRYTKQLPIYIHPDLREVEIGQGAAAQHIPFSDISCVETDSHPGPMAKTMVIDIRAVLMNSSADAADSARDYLEATGLCHIVLMVRALAEDYLNIAKPKGGTIQLGTVSGDEKRTPARADDIAYLLAGTLGVQVR